MEQNQNVQTEIKEALKDVSKMTSKELWEIRCELATNLPVSHFLGLYIGFGAQACVLPPAIMQQCHLPDYIVYILGSIIAVIIVFFFTRSFLKEKPAMQHNRNITVQALKIIDAEIQRRGGLVHFLSAR